MIDPKDLRKGNLVVLAHESNAPIVSITEIRSLGVYAEYAPGDGSSYYLFGELLPIELNSDWFEKCGFENKNFGRWGEGWAIPIMASANRYLGVCNMTHRTLVALVSEGDRTISLNTIHCVHQLQNIYYDFKSEDLSIKSFNQSN